MIAPHRLGKLPAQPARPQLKASRFLNTSQLPDPPDTRDWLTEISRWPMYANDRYGDCVPAGMHHQARQIVNLAQAHDVTFTDPDVLKVYSDITGFNPDVAATDQGTYVIDGMSYWRKTGLTGQHQTLAYASVDPSDTRLVKQCIALFGAVGVGFNFPVSAWSQFSSRQPWDYVAGARIDGGHYVMAGAYSPDMYTCVTWGATQRMTQQFWSRYVDECWVVIDDEMANFLTGNSFAGVNLYRLGEDFTALTGEPNPIPAPAPPPVPQLRPATPPDRALREAQGGWAHTDGRIYRKQRRAFVAWENTVDWS